MMHQVFFIEKKRSLKVRIYFVFQNCFITYSSQKQKFRRGLERYKMRYQKFPFQIRLINNQLLHLLMNLCQQFIQLSILSEVQYT
ncbi:unnamed protein product [Paramecium sonneborni]|uniref:Uncharacterized protein n=1 Tax=Paramecium sonneborni TaxID=65129 RepID=A0A8S1RNN0_9CILI|nr:unnamed protein product [Paramecium sonneborni]